MCSKHLRSVFDFPENIGDGGEREGERVSLMKNWFKYL